MARLKHVKEEVCGRCRLSSRQLSFVFFQAEDGIRDIGVTGVQTVLFRSGSDSEAGSPLPSTTVSSSLVPGLSDQLQPLEILVRPMCLEFDHRHSRAGCRWCVQSDRKSTRLNS